MTLLDQTWFGAGGGDPYDHALRTDRASTMVLRGGETDAEVQLDRWRATADATDLRLLAGLRGPLLDVGCGPGRMVAAARELGIEGWGLDVSPAAVDHARRLGLPVVPGSIFDPLPLERRWQSILLLDGNIGIGGDVEALLRRCRDLLAPHGSLVVELHPDDDRDLRYAGRIVDLAGRESADFPWAEIGLGAFVPAAARVGLRVAQARDDTGRVFCELRRAARMTPR